MKLKWISYQVLIGFILLFSLVKPNPTQAGVNPQTVPTAIPGQVSPPHQTPTVQSPSSEPRPSFRFNQILLIFCAGSMLFLVIGFVFVGIQNRKHNRMAG